MAVHGGFGAGKRLLKGLSGVGWNSGCGRSDLWWSAPVARAKIGNAGGRLSEPSLAPA